MNMLKTYYPCDIKLWFMYFVTNILPFHLCKNNDKKGEYINGRRVSFSVIVLKKKLP